MADQSTIIACDNLGTNTSLNGLPCCRTGDMNSPTCRNFFGPVLKQGLLGRVCLGPDPTCPLFMNCSDVSSLYSSLEQTDQKGDGSWLIRRYVACANMPRIAGLAWAGKLSRNISNVVTEYIPRLPKLNAFETRLQLITSSVTDCLSSTCRASRDVDYCYDNHCSPTKLLINGTLPNLEGINDCMYTLCNSDRRALPWPDADVVGIGVFSSYMMQCALVVALWIGLLLFSWQRMRRGQTEWPSKVHKPSKHFAAWIDLLLEFHKTQCYFGGTLMIASIITAISGVDIVITFLLVPLATNSILPIVFAYVLLLYFRSSSRAITLLTTAVYTLSSIVYWVLYSHLIFQAGINAKKMIRLYKLQLSTLPACGGYSGLAVCPFNSQARDVEQGIDARHKLRVLTPLIWTFSTFVLAVALVFQGYQTYAGSRKRYQLRMESRRWRAAFWVTTVVFLAGVGMQLAVLWTAKLLGMVNDGDWGFGQIVAVTIWIPPLLEYLFGEINGVFSKRVNHDYQGVPNRSDLHTEKEERRTASVEGVWNEEN